MGRAAAKRASGEAIFVICHWFIDPWVFRVLVWMLVRWLVVRFTEGRTTPPSKEERVPKRGPAAAFGVVCFLLVRLFLVLPRLSAWLLFDCLFVCRMVSYVLRKPLRTPWEGDCQEGPCGRLKEDFARLVCLRFAELDPAPGAVRGPFASSPAGARTPVFSRCQRHVKKNYLI